MLIHEATFEDDLQSEALKKKHRYLNSRHYTYYTKTKSLDWNYKIINHKLFSYSSTTTEAIECGQKMKAKFVLLNHFSQRYPKIPVFSEKFNDCTGIAFDHMMVRIGLKN